MNKDELRAKLKAQRLKLNSSEVKSLSLKVSNRVQELLNMLSFSSLHVYLPEEKLHEINTWLLIKSVLKKWPEAKIAYAPFNGPLKFESLWLKDGSKVPDDFQFDLIIVPQLGFDNHGYRLGYGGGFYDRFLATQKNAEVIGLCYDFGHFDSLPHEPHDIPIKTIVTEKQIYKF